jgi:hypothetical protein
MSYGRTKLQRENQEGSDWYWKIVDDLCIYNKNTLSGINDLVNFISNAVSSFTG